MKWFKCSKCGESKPKTEFYRDRSRPTGYRPDCKPCTKAGVDIDRRREYEKEYREKNKERRAEIVRKSMAKNADHHREVRRAYLKTDAGRAAYRSYTQTRYARRKAAFVEHVDPNAVYESQDGKCYLCGTELPFSEMHLDHVVPIAKGGKHEKSNCKIACASCNFSKGAKLLREVQN